MDRRITGRWRLLRADRSLDFAPEVEMDFREDGSLLYSLKLAEGGWHTFTLNFALEGDELRTETPGPGHVATAHVTFGAGDSLILDFAGAKAWFVRAF